MNFHPVLGHIIEIAVSAVAIVVVASSRLLLVAAPDTPATEALQQYIKLQWLLLPLIGALLACMCALLLNPSLEKRKVVMGRSIPAMVGGVAIPKIISLFHPSLRNILVEPSIIILTGFCVGFIVYILARPFVEKFYGKAAVMAGDLEVTVETKVRKITGTSDTTETIKSTSTTE